MQLSGQLPKKEIFTAQMPNFKIYIDQLPEEIKTKITNILNLKDHLNIGEEMIRNPSYIWMIRHLESAYNIYIKTSKLYKAFLKEKDPNQKRILADGVQEEFLRIVGVDPLTGLSKKGKEDGEKIQNTVGQFYKENPDLMPTFIVVSPYLRTRLTAMYFLKSTGIDVDWGDFTQSTPNSSYIKTRWGEKEITIVLDDRVRERSFGTTTAPRDVISFLEGDKTKELLTTEQKELSYYYDTGRFGGESQVQCNERLREFIGGKILRKTGKGHKHIAIFGHHLGIVGEMTNITGPNPGNFQKINNNLRPSNGSITPLIIGKSEEGETMIRMGSSPLNIL